MSFEAALCLRLKVLALPPFPSLRINTKVPKIYNLSPMLLPICFQLNLSAMKFGYDFLVRQSHWIERNFQNFARHQSHNESEFLLSMPENANAGDQLGPQRGVLASQYSIRGRRV